MVRTVAWLAILLCVTYALDYAILRLRLTAKGQAFGSVTVYRYYAIQEKANKVNYVFLDSQSEKCVHSLFPHLSCSPCWYASRHTERKVDI